MRFHPLFLLSTLLVVILPLMPQNTAAQPQRRWLADLELVGPVRSIGPTDLVQSGNGITAMDLIDSKTGWAVSYRGLLRFDGRFWLPGTTYSGPEQLNALDLVHTGNGWAVGNDFRGGPPTIGITRYDGQQWEAVRDIVGKDGAVGNFAGALYDVAALDVGGAANALAVGVAYVQNQAGFYDRQRPLVLYFDGHAWRDTTPDAWQDGKLWSVSMTGPGEAWVAGQSGPDQDGRVLIARLENDRWIEEAAPPLPRPTNGLTIDLTMRDRAEGWAAVRYAPADQQSCATGRLLRRSNGGWTLTPPEAHRSQPVVLGLIPGTNRGWASLIGCDTSGAERPGQRMRFDTGTFSHDPTGTEIVPTVYALLSEETQWAAGVGRPMRFSAEALPTEPIAAAGPDGRYFTDTGHTLAGDFQRYYESRGLELGEPGISGRESLALFGYPLSEPFTEMNPDTGELLLVQYFERARMEYHPANPEPYRVLLGRLGASSLIGRAGALRRPTGDPAPVNSDCQTFVETGWSLCSPFRAWWQRNGGLAVYGFPIKEAAYETSQTDGQRYLTQWFERERLEYHPENVGTPYEVLLGLLGAEELRIRGYLP